MCCYSGSHMVLPLMPWPVRPHRLPDQGRASIGILCRAKFPELESLVHHPIDYARVVKAIGNEMDITLINTLEDILPQVRHSSLSPVHFGQHCACVRSVGCKVLLQLCVRCHMQIAAQRAPLTCSGMISHAGNSHGGVSDCVHNCRAATIRGQPEEAAACLRRGAAA